MKNVAHNNKYWHIRCHKTGKRAIVFTDTGDNARKLANKALGWWENAFSACHDFQVAPDVAFSRLQFAFSDPQGAGFHTEYNKTPQQAFNAMDDWCGEDMLNDGAIFAPVAEVL